jgi:transcriptional regulator with XRE-family HTH domain
VNKRWDESFGTHLAWLRRAAGLTQEQLADRAELSVRAISSLECGARLPRRLTLDRLSAALDLTLAQRGELTAAAAKERRRGTPHAVLPFAGLAVPFVGRGAELAELRAHLDGDGPPVLIYTGVAGIGKSRMLAEAVTVGTRSGLPVLAAAGRRRGDRYAPIADALADHVRRTPHNTLVAQVRGCAGLDLVLPELAGRVPRLPAQQERRLVMEAVGRFLDNIADRRRLLLVLDDVQWAEPEAAELLAHLVRRGWPRTRVVLSCRAGVLAPDGLLGQYVADLARARLVRGRRLAPLPPAEADRLVTVTAGTGNEPLAAATRARILRRSGGLPLFLVELTQAARHGAGELPWHLRLTAMQQLAEVPEPVVRLLRRLAATGPCVRPEELAQQHLPIEEVLDLLEVASRFAVLEETRQGFAFRHPLVREVLAGSLGPSRRRLWRREPARSHVAAGRRRTVIASSP